MIFRSELEEKGFTFIENPGLDRMLYDFSDFELFECNVREHTKVNGDKCLAISNLKMRDYINNKDYFSINYTLYFDDINKFYELLTSLGYRIC